VTEKASNPDQAGMINQAELAPVVRDEELAQAPILVY